MWQTQIMWMTPLCTPVWRQSPSHRLPVLSTWKTAPLSPPLLHQRQPVASNSPFWTNLKATLFEILGRRQLSVCDNVTLLMPLIISVRGCFRMLTSFFYVATTQVSTLSYYSKINSQQQWKKKNLKESWLPAFWKKIQNTQEIKRTLFNKPEQDKTCKFLMESSFLSYVQYNRKQLNLLIFVR